MKLFVTLIAVLCVSAGLAMAQGVCTSMTTAGNWGFTCSGNLMTSATSPLIPTQILGTCTATPDGTFTCEGTVSLGGGILKQNMVGTGITAPNCTGTIKYTQKLNDGPAPDMNIRYLVLDNGKTIKGLPIDPGSNLLCTLTRM